MKLFMITILMVAVIMEQLEQQLHVRACMVKFTVHS